MKKILTLNLGIILFLGFISCSSQTRTDLHDLITVLTIPDGTSVEYVISDLFYSDSYDGIEFEPHKNLTVTYSGGKLEVKPDEGFSGASFLKFSLNGDDYAIAVNVVKVPRFKFSYKPEKEYNTITLFGQFNSWNRENMPMTDNDGDGVYEILIPLDPGEYQYRFYLDGEEILDPLNSDSVSNGMGGYNSVFRVKESKVPSPYLHLISHSGDNDFLKINFSLETSSDSEFRAGGLIGNFKLPNNYFNLNGKSIELRIPRDELPGEKIIRVGVDQNGTATNFQTLVFIDGKPAANGDAFKWYDGVIYSLMIDRFNDGDESLNNPIVHDSLFEKANYNGGDLQGIIDKLNEGYFENLGINILWISPVYDNPNEAFREYPAPHRWYSGYHGYWPIHHEKVDEHFGTIEKLKELVNTAHEKNIKVLLDFVSNHVHEQHVFYREHPEWFGNLELPDGRLNLRMWDEHRLTTWFEPYLPSYDLINSSEAMEALTENALWWLNESGADGFRHDAVKHVPNEFWRELTRKIKERIETKNNVQIYQVGETFGDYDLVSSYVNNGQLSAQFNFNLYNTAQAVFIDPDISFKDLKNELIKTSNVYGILHVMGNIMDSHDKNRYMAYTDGDLKLEQWSAVEEGWNNPPKVDDPRSYDKAKIYLAYMNSIPGLPVVYYGSEFGMTGASDPDNRRTMRFDDELSEHEKNMLNDVAEMIKMRNKHTALRYGDLYFLEADDNTFVYIRSDLNERILVAINKSEENVEMQINIPREYGVTSLTDLLTGEVIRVLKGAASFELTGISYRFLNLNQ